VRRQTPATWLAGVFGSTIGLKFIMALTGIGLSLFVLGHMAANLLAFVSPKRLDDYGAALRTVPAMLWAARVGLLGAVGLHIWAYLALTSRSLSARPKAYREASYREASFASRSMRWTGPLLLVFVVYHLLDLTIGAVNPGFRPGEVYRNMVASLSRGPIAAFYLVALGALAFHLWHGIWSMFQSLGLSQPRHESLARRVATLFTIAVAGGFALVPLAVLAGWLK
jgi:succinate dehydrogenase / fumarate reductase cytochrome b subunit